MATEERCVMCGEVIPEGQQVCPNCKSKVVWRNPKVKTLIAVPCMDTVPTEFMESMVHLREPEGTQLAVVKNTLIYNARNTIIQNAVKLDFDRVLWLDSDMVFEPDLLLRMIDDLDLGIDYVAGLYYQRKLPTHPVVYKEIHWKVADDGWVDTGYQFFEPHPKDKLFEIAGSGFGCVMTSMDLLKRMVEVYGAPFSPLMGMGEDLTFCHRVKEQGFKMYCDPRIKLGHVGKFIYTEGVATDPSTGAETE